MHEREHAGSCECRFLVTPSWRNGIHGWRACQSMLSVVRAPLTAAAACPSPSCSADHAMAETTAAVLLDRECRPPAGMTPRVPASTRWLRQVQDVRMAVGFEGPNTGERTNGVFGTPCH
jgi:hypothetical protein